MVVVKREQVAANTKFLNENTPRVPASREAIFVTL